MILATMIPADATAAAGALLLKVTVVLTGAMIVVATMRKTSAARRHLVWHVGLSSTVALTLLQLLVPAIGIPVADDSLLGAIAKTRVAQVATRHTDIAPTVTIAGNRARNSVPSSVATANRAFAQASSRRGAYAPMSFEGADSAAASKASALTSMKAAAQATESATHAAIGTATNTIGSERRALVGSAGGITSGSPQRTLTDFAGLFAIAWMCGALFVLARLAVAHVHLARIVRHANVPETRWKQQLTQAQRALGVASPVTLLVSTTAPTPFTAGWPRPVVVLPSGSTMWEAERCRVVLLHELAHVARGDYFAQLVATIACALFWFHPLVWIAARGLRNESERAADDSVLRSGMPSLHYASHLLALASPSAMNMTPSVAFGMARSSQLEWRLRAMLDTTRSRNAVSRKMQRLSAVTVVLALVPAAGLRPEMQAATHTASTHTRSTQTAPTATPEVDALRDAVHVPAPTIARVVGDVRTMHGVKTPPAAESPIADSAPESSPLATTSSLSSGELQSDSVIKRTLAVSDSVVVSLVLDTGGDMTLYRWDGDSIKAQVVVGSNRAGKVGMTLERRGDTATMHAFFTDSTRGLSPDIHFELWVPTRARLASIDARGSGGFRVRTRGQSSVAAVVDTGNMMSANNTSATIIGITGRGTYTAAQDSARTAATYHKTSETTTEQTLGATPGQSLTINLNSNGNVIVHGWNEPSVKLLTTLIATPTTNRPAILERNDRGVYLRPNDAGNRGPGRTYANPFNPDANRYELWVPRETSIAVSVLGGVITIENVDGRLSGGTAFGAIDLRNVTGTAELRTVIGNVSVTNSKLSGSVSTQCGTVTLADVTGGLSGVGKGFVPDTTVSKQPIMIVDGKQVPQLRRYCNLKVF